MNAAGASWDALVQGWSLWGTLHFGRSDGRLGG